MTDQEFRDKYEACERLLKDLASTGPQSVAEYLFGSSGEAQVRANEFVLGYWQGNQDAKVFVRRGGHHSRWGSASINERWLSCVEQALRAQTEDGK